MALSKTLLTLGILGTIAGGAGAYVYFQGIPGMNGGGPMAQADVVPQDAIAVAYVSTDLQTWGKLEQFGTPDAQAAIAQGLGAAQQSLQQGTNLSFTEDIAPWIDGALIAALPAANGSLDPSPDSLIVVGIKNPVRAAQVLKKIQQAPDTKLSEQTYEGIKITKLEQGKEATFTAVLGTNQLVISNELSPIQWAIATHKGQPSLADQPATKTAFANTLGLQTPLIQTYVPQYGQALTTLFPMAGEANTRQLEQLTEKVGAAVGVLGIEDQGLRLKGTLQTDPGLRPAQFQNNPNQSLARFPANTLMYSNLHNVSTAWSMTSDHWASTQSGKQALDGLKTLVKSTGVDLDQDVFSWMDGELAFGLLPQNQGMTGALGAGAVIVADSGDRPATEGLLKKLDKLAKQNRLGVSQRQQGSIKVTEWKMLGIGETALGYGWFDNDSMFMAMGTPLVNQMAQTPPQALSQNPNFQKAIAGLPNQNLGYSYVNVPEALKILEPQLTPVAASNTPQAQSAKTMLAVLKSVEAIAATATWEQPEQSAFDLRVNLVRR